MCLFYSAYVPQAQERIKLDIFIFAYLMPNKEFSITYASFFLFGSQRNSHLSLNMVSLQGFPRFRTWTHQTGMLQFQCVFFLVSWRFTSWFTWQVNYLLSILVKMWEDFTIWDLCRYTVFKNASWTHIFLSAFGKCLKRNLFQYKCRKIGTQTKPQL